MRTLLVAACSAVLVVTGGGVAVADPHPSQGDHSTVRNENGFGEGPHCHVLINNRTPFDSSPAFPSHQGHSSSGVGHVFNADPNCDGDAGA